MPLRGGRGEGVDPRQRLLSGHSKKLFCPLRGLRGGGRSELMEHVPKEVDVFWRPPLKHFSSRMTENKKYTDEEGYDLHDNEEVNIYNKENVWHWWNEKDSFRNWQPRKYYKRRWNKAFYDDFNFEPLHILLEKKLEDIISNIIKK